jgi:Alr-MurF fusion protein
MEFTTARTAKILSARLLGAGRNKFTELVTDSRSAGAAAHTLFVCIRGERHNGHAYIREMYAQGCRSFLVSEEHVYYRELAGAAFLLVKDTLKSLQDFAAFKRSQFGLPVIGITGSNGKTIVKEWLWQLLEPDYTVCKNPKSYNSQIGVPLSVWQLNETHNLALFEAGISQPGEMEKLERVIAPTSGLITNIGSAHDENFESRQQKTDEKLKLFLRCKTILYCRDYPTIVKGLAGKKFARKKKISWSQKGPADLRIISRREKDGHTLLKGRFKKKEVELTVPFRDEASVENCLHCWLYLLQAGYRNEVIQHRVSSLAPLGMRLEMKQGINRCTIINDSYSNDIHSLRIALDFLRQQKQHESKIVILSDIPQTGKNSAELYREVNRLLRSRKISEFIGIGKELSENRWLIEGKKYFFYTTEKFIDAVRQNKLAFSNSDILIKGARSFGFERIQKLLQEKSHDTVLEINLNNLVHNLNYFRSKLRPGVGIMPMVKAFSYGSGSFEIANALQHHRVTYFAVAYADEGVELRKNGIATPVLVMNPELQSLDQFIQYNLEPEIFSFAMLEEFARHLALNRVSLKDGEFPVHIKIDTGMHRLGFEEKDIPRLKDKLREFSFLKVKSIFSHLAGSDEPSLDAFTREQVALFDKLSVQLAGSLGYPVMRHICNTGGISRFPEAHFDLVRLGIGLYGVGATENDQRHLLNVSSLKTTISQLKHLQPGDTVGYSRRGKITRPTTIATVPIGYADGLNRRLGNGNGILYLHDKPAPIVGSVCMDMCMIDVTGLNAKEGDEVVVFDSYERLKKLADTLGTITYEVLTSVSGRVKRVYLQE